jgi:hypothetical protein
MVAIESITAYEEREASKIQDKLSEPYIPCRHRPIGRRHTFQGHLSSRVAFGPAPYAPSVEHG